MYSCVDCSIRACSEKEPLKIPKNCPLNDVNLNKEILKEYEKQDVKEFFLNSCRIEAKGYCNWSRVEETIRFCQSMGYQKLGIAFCDGLRREARILSQLLKKHGFSVASVICKNGRIPKEDIGLKKEEKVEPGNFETMCNPVGQAYLLNEEKTDFNIVVGLCVGHDALFFRYSKAPATVLIVKDRVLAHNPAGALYCSEGYYEKKLNINR